jgi:class 3 adenylate cyclase
VPAERVDALVAIGVLRPAIDGSFVAGDLQRVQIIDAYERGGVSLDLVERAIREGRMTFDATDRIYPPASPPSGRTLADLEAELDLGPGVLPQLFLALGRPRPDPDRPLTLADEQGLRMLVQAWTAPVLGGEPLNRAARLLGESARRIAEGWINLFIEALALPPEVGARMTVDELRPRMIEPAAAIAQALQPALAWSLAYHMEQKLNEVNIEGMERALEADGIRPPADREPPAILFADISGFTQLAEERGDDLAVGHAASLADLALVVAADHDGRFVKQLGDGVMLVFARAGDAADASLGLLDAAREAGLPALHIGISAGPFIERDGDYFGRTVNLASRLSGVAGPGEVVMNQAAADAAGRPVVAQAPASIKGLPTAIPVFRLDRERQREPG